VLQCVAECCNLSQCVAVCRSVSQCVAVCRSVLQCVEVGGHTGVLRVEHVHAHRYVCCSALQCVERANAHTYVLQCVAVCCSALQRVAVRCSALQFEGISLYHNVYHICIYMYIHMYKYTHTFDLSHTRCVCDALSTCVTQSYARQD